VEKVISVSPSDKNLPEAKQMIPLDFLKNSEDKEE
jgi:hypothetical protein